MQANEKAKKMISNSDLYKINTDRDEQIKEVMQSKVLADIKKFQAYWG